MITLLLIRPGALLDGVDALLVSIPGVQMDAHSNNADTALEFCKQNNTELVILEVRPDDRGLLNIVSEIKGLCPQGHVVAIIHDEKDRQCAEQSGVDLIMSIGTRASELKESIKELANSSVEES
jgi:DNA-binding NarL/FixJ family response regulator